MTYKDDLLGGRGAAASTTEDLLLVAKDLLEICRIKCSPTDEVWRADGISNERVMIAAMKAIERAEFALRKKPRPIKPSQFDMVGNILGQAVIRGRLRD